MTKLFKATFKLINFVFEQRDINHQEKNFFAEIIFLSYTHQQSSKDKNSFSPPPLQMFCLCSSYTFIISSLQSEIVVFQLPFPCISVPFSYNFLHFSRTFFSTFTFPSIFLLFFMTP